MAARGARHRLANNPFYVLGLRPTCARAEVEREGQKLLGMLELGLAGSDRYRSPLGEHRRGPEHVREAMAELRDPDRRLVHELWATLDPENLPDALAAPVPDETVRPTMDDTPEVDRSPFPGLLTLGFRSRRGLP